MKSFKEQIDTYNIQHTNPVNRITHYIGIPLIVFSLLMALNWVSLDIAKVWIIPFSWLLVIIGLVYYCLLHFRLAIAMAIIIIPLTFLAIWIAGPTPTKAIGITSAILFFSGWALQFLGHFFEKNRPAFFQSLVQLLIGPLFVLIELLGALKVDRFFIKPQKQLR